MRRPGRKVPRRKARQGGSRLSLWVIALLALTPAVVSGVAVGPVLLGFVSSSTGMAVSQTVTLDSAPIILGADDSVGTRNDDGTSFLAAMGTHADQIQNVALSFDNNSGADASATLSIDLPPGFDAEAHQGLGIREAQLGRNTWLMNVFAGQGVSWDSTTADSTGDAGLYTSVVAVDPNTILVSYHDWSNGTLKFAKSVDGGTTYALSTVDSTADVGRYTSIAAPDQNTVFISYYDADNGTLKFARSIDGGATFGLSVIDSSADVGKYASLEAVDAGAIFISYYDSDNGDLKFARSLNGGSSWNPPGTTVLVDSAGDVGQYTSIAAMNSSTILISYYDVSSGALKFARSLNGGSTWNPMGTATVVDASADVGQYTSIAAANPNAIFISYYDVTNGDLKFAKSMNNGSSWNPAGTATLVEAAGDVGRFTSLKAVDSTTVFISYYDVTNGRLRFAKSADGGLTFTVKIVDSSAEVGQYASITSVGPNTIMVTYYDANDGGLKLAKSGSDDVHITVRAKAGLAPGFYDMTGTVVQVP